MRCYKVSVAVSGGGVAVRYASTNADSKTVRDKLAEAKSVSKKDVKIVQTDIPLAKAELLEFINDLCAKAD